MCMCVCMCVYMHYDVRQLILIDDQYTHAHMHAHTPPTPTLTPTLLAYLRVTFLLYIRNDGLSYQLGIAHHIQYLERERDHYNTLKEKETIYNRHHTQ